MEKDDVAPPAPPRAADGASRAEALGRAQDMLSAVYRNSDIGIFILEVSEDGRFRFEGINPVQERLFGVPEAELLGRTPGELAGLGRAPLPHLGALCEECVRRREPIESELEVSEGPARGWWLSRLTPVLDPGSGRVVRIVGGGVPITERKRAEQALRESEARARDSEAQARARHADLEQLYDLTPVGLFTLDRELRFTRINDVMAAINGLPAAAHLGRTVDEVVPELAPGLRALYRPIFERGEPVLDVEIHGPTPKAPGVMRDWIGSYYPLRDAAGEVVGLVGAVLEVTGRKAAERALRASEERLREGESFLAFALGASHIGVWDLDLEDHSARRSPEHDTIFGYPERLPEWTHELFLSHVLPEDREEVDRGFRMAKANRSDWSFECRIRRRDGETRWIGGVGRHRVDARSGRLRMAGIVQDVTARKLDEQRLKASLADLERALEVTRRTEEKLRQSQKMEAVGQLAGGVAHDFNNLLTVILGNVEAVAASLRPGDPLREDVLEIQRAGQRAAALTKHLLAFSRKQVLEPRVVDLNLLVGGVERMLRRLIGEDVELTLLLERRVHPCLLDPGQVEQVLVNLAVNARDAMPDGGRLTIETANVTLDEAYAREHPEARAGDHVRVTVSDTGVGMNREVLAHAFEPFFTTKEQGRGTGLGLSTVYGIVRQSGGTVWVYSEPGQGTTFKLYFPRTDAVASDVPPRTAPASPAPARGTETVLLVEDDDQVRATLAAMLRRAGYHVIAASNGGEALLVCEQHGGTIHLLLTDVVMPKLNGRKLAERLRQIRPGLRVVFMSGYTENAIVHHGVLDPGLDFLAKPVSADVLLAKVREVLDR